jgi:hypothetical protein
VREAEPVSPGAGGPVTQQRRHYHQPAKNVCIRSQASIRDLDDTAGWDRVLSFPRDPPIRPFIWKEGHHVSDDFNRQTDLTGSESLASQQTHRHQDHQTGFAQHTTLTAHRSPGTHLRTNKTPQALSLILQAESTIQTRSRKCRLV